MAKDPAERHERGAAFRYELNTVMDMLDMGRRKRSNPAMRTPVVPRDALLATMFDASRLPQMLVSETGTILLANPAIRALLGRETPLEGVALGDTPLAGYVPGLGRAIRTAVASGKPTERRAQIFRGAEQPPLIIAIWLAPVPPPSSDVHLLVRVEDS